MKRQRRGPSSFRELFDWLKEDGGYAVEYTKGGHRAIRNPRGKRVATLPTTPSDRRAFKNAVSMMRRLTGLELRR